MQVGQLCLAVCEQPELLQLSAGVAGVGTTDAPAVDAVDSAVAGEDAADDMVFGWGRCKGEGADGL